MKQIDNRQKIMTKSRAERARLGKHDPQAMKQACEHHHDHTHEHEHGHADSKETSSPESQPVSHPKIGRNDPCPCGSGKKYKKCCLDKIV